MPVAETAIPDVLFERGLYWASGRSGVVNLVAAHKWFNLAALKGRADAISLRREVAELMSDVEIATASAKPAPGSRRIRLPRDAAILAQIPALFSAGRAKNPRGCCAAALHSPDRQLGPSWKRARLAETEGFEPSIGLYNPITV